MKCIQSIIAVQHAPKYFNNGIVCKTPSLLRRKNILFHKTTKINSIWVFRESVRQSDSQWKAFNQIGITIPFIYFYLLPKMVISNYQSKIFHKGMLRTIHLWSQRLIAARFPIKPRDQMPFKVVSFIILLVLMVVLGFHLLHILCDSMRFNSHALTCQALVLYTKKPIEVHGRLNTLWI